MFTIIGGARMKKFTKLLLAFSIIGIVAFTTNQNVSAATTDEIRKACGYDSMEKVNPNFGTMNCLLTQTALAYNVPPEIVKAIAESESGDWKHFDENGEAIITGDNGIGIMQITNQSGYDVERLKNDIVYNIKAGVEILDYMYNRSDLPKINTKERDVLEHWYFAIMAYNGTKPVNSPIIQATGAKNKDAYQEKVFTTLENFSLIKLADLPFTKNDFRYDPNSTANIEFVTKQYYFNVPFTKSKHFFKTGQNVVTTTDTRLRTEPTTSSNHYPLNKGEVLTITGPFVYDKDPTKKNHFVWYPVKRQNGTTGFIASSYIKYRFKDIPAGYWAATEIDYLVDRGILKGVGDDKFGIGQNLSRWQAAVLLARAQNLSLTNRPDPGFVDVSKNYPYYSEIAAVVDEGIFEGLPGNKFDPDATLTRAQMAAVLQRIYNFPAPTKEHNFKDVKKDDWYADSVARLYAAGITTGVDKDNFGTNVKITREQFAVFMVRSMDESFRK